MHQFFDPLSWDGENYLDSETWNDLYATDVVTPVVAESPTITAGTGATDSVTSALGEAHSILLIVPVVASDSLTVLATETRADVATDIQAKFGVDTLTPVFAEVGTPAVVFRAFSSVDTLDVTLSSLTNIEDVAGVLAYHDIQSWQIGVGYSDHETWGVSAVTEVGTSSVLTPVLVEVAKVALVQASVDTTTVTLTEVANVLGIGVTPKNTTDALIVVLTETPTVVEVTFLTGTDDLLVDLFENRAVFGGGTTVNVSDTIAPNAIEGLLNVRQIRTDDNVGPLFGEIGTSPATQAVFKSASDSVTVLFSVEQWNIAAFGASYPVATDTITPIATDNSTSLFQFINKTGVDVITVSGLDVVASLIRAEVRVASDTLLPFFAAEAQTLAAFDPPDPGELPPGWYSIEEEELAGIIEPWLTNPNLTTHPQGWFTRAYWAVYDTNARLRVTDGSRKAAHSQAWTKYQIVDKRGKAEIT